VDAGRTLLFDREKLIALAEGKGIAIEAFSPPFSSLAAEPKAGNKGMSQG